MDVYTYPPALPRRGIELEIRDIKLTAALEPYGPIGEIKEQLYYPLLQVKRELDDFLTQRPNIGYAIEPLAPNGDEPPFIRHLLKVGESLETGPIAALEGAIVDLALETLNPLGRDITVSIGRIVGTDYRRTLIVPAFNGDYGSEIPPKTMTVATGEKLTVVSFSGAIAGAALTRGEDDLALGVDPKDITTALSSHKEIRGGLRRTEKSVKGWGGIVPILMREVQR